MGYELTVDLKGGRLEIEADSVEELEERVQALDVKRLEALLAQKRRGGGAKKATKKGAKKSAAKGAKKGAKKARKATRKATKRVAKGPQTPGP